MFRNYLLVSFRTLWRNRTQSLINIIGLALGMACALLIGLFIADEISYDRFHPKEDRLYKAYNRNTFEGDVHCWSTTPAPLAPTLKAQYPGIAATARFTLSEPYMAAFGDKKVTLKGSFTDPDLLTMFSFPLLRGNVRKALSTPTSVVITQATAEKLFGGADPLGKLVRFNNKYDFTVGGVLQTPPKNTELEFDLLLPWSSLKSMYGYDDIYWGNNSYRTYVELAPTATLATVNAAIRDVTIRHSKGDEDNEVFLYPSARWHLYGNFENGVESGGYVTYVRLAGYIAAFILLLACINFMNLSTARSEKRSREVGIRKVVGANRWSLIGQFLGESLLLTATAFLLALLLAQLALPALNILTEKQLQVPYGTNLFWLACVGLVLLTGSLAGSYPALFLSAMQPIRVLKGRFTGGHRTVSPRQLLVIFQFVITVTLLISTIVVKRQLAHTQDRNTGYDRSSLVYTGFTGDTEKNYDVIRAELMQQGIATAVCKTSGLITQSSSNTWGLSWRGKPEGSKITFDQLNSTGDFAKTMGLTILAGRDLDGRTHGSDTSACLVNETAAKIMGFKQPLGQVIRNGDTDFRIVGVFKDFIWGSPFGKVPPMLVRGKGWANSLHYRLNPTMPTTLAMQKAAVIFRRYNPAFPFDVKFVDQEYQRKFDRVRAIGTMADVFAVLAVIIACLGLFGLATFMAEQRTKEIGVRKVLGASVSSLVALLSKDFVKLVLVAILIAVPLAWWAMSRWLEDYTYRTPLDWWLFAGAGLLAVVIALLTIGYQSLRAALIDPVQAIRTGE